MKGVFIVLGTAGRLADISLIHSMFLDGLSASVRTRSARVCLQGANKPWRYLVHFRLVGSNLSVPMSTKRSLFVGNYSELKRAYSKLTLREE